MENNFLHNHPNLVVELQNRDSLPPGHAIVDRKDWEKVRTFLEGHPQIASIIEQGGFITEHKTDTFEIREGDARTQAIQMLRERGVLRPDHTQWWVTFPDGSQVELIQLMVDFKYIPI